MAARLAARRPARRAALRRGLQRPRRAVGPCRARPLFFSGNFGREPLFIYAQALSVWAFGPSARALRLVAVACGMLTVALTFAACRRLLGTWAALAAAAWIATAAWAVVFSRVGLRAVAVPLLLSLVCYALARAIDACRPRRAAALAVVDGLALAGSIAT